MIKIIIISLLAVGLHVSANDNEYVIGIGDEIAIRVYNEPDLNVKAKISRSGLIRVPLIGDINVVGKTAQAVSAQIEAELFDGYLVDPNVSVLIEAVRPFYIRGAVTLPSAYQLNLGMTVEQAIAVAGGLTERASNSKWYIIREGDSERFKANQDTPVQPGDIIEIEESFF